MPLAVRLLLPLILSACVDVTHTLAHEFRYALDAPLLAKRAFAERQASFARHGVSRVHGDSRVRYYQRDRHPTTLAPIQSTEKWHEYLGSSVYADLELSSTAEPDILDSAATRRYLHAGDGRLIGWYDYSADEWRFVHADMLGTTRLVTDEDGYIGTGASTPGGAALAYSAFGEILGQATPGGSDARSRYGYCGGWGYQNDGLEDPAREIGMLHVGARYLEPGLGRFLQRDSIGIRGGLSLYAYVLQSPTVVCDPTGNFPAGPTEVAAALGVAIGFIWYSQTHFQNTPMTNVSSILLLVLDEAFGTALATACGKIVNNRAQMMLDTLASVPRTAYQYMANAPGAALGFMVGLYVGAIEAEITGQILGWK